jgi:predicted Zn-dependent peptidase
MKQAYKKTILNNGLKIITHAMTQMQSVALGVWIKVGGRYESGELKGIAHFLEHLAFKGTKKYSCRKLKESIEGIGGSLNGFTSEELTCYLAKLPANYLDLALDILSDMVINPLLQGDDIEKERTVIIEEIKMYKDLPHSYVHELLDELLWPQQPLGTTISGTIESISRISKFDMSSFKEAHYTTPNIVISAAGMLEHNTFRRRIEKIFSGLGGKNINRFLPVKEEQTKPQLKIFAKDTEQTHLALGFHGLKRDHSLRYALWILHIILGANMSSRLFNELREKRGLAYEIGTQTKYFQDTGSFIVHAGIDNRKVNEAIRLILKELDKVRHKLVSIDEFKRAKDFYLGQLMLSLEDTLDHMLWIGESTTTLDEVYTLGEIIKKVKRIKREDIQELSCQIFKEKNLNLALIGPLGSSEQTIYNELYLG